LLWSRAKARVATAVLKGGSSKGVEFKPVKLGNFDGSRDQKVVDAWLTEMEDYFHAAKVG
jgi:hypothetical protein